MASTYSTLKIELIGTGEQAGLWGTTTNTNLGTAIEEAIVGSADVAFSSSDVTLTLTDVNTTQAARHVRLNLTGTSGGARNLILGSGCQIDKPYLINNGLADTVTVKNTAGTGIAVPAGKTMWVYNNGTNVVDAVTHLSSLTLGTALPIASGGTGTTSTTFVNLATNVTGDLPFANLTQIAGLSVLGVTGNSTADVAGVTAGTDNQVLRRSGTALAFGAVNLASSDAVTGALTVTNGGTGGTTQSTARTGLGASTLGGNLFTITNPSAITFPRFNADNTVSSLSAADFRTAIGAGTGGGTVTSVATGTGLTGGPISTTGTVSVATNGITDSLLRQSAGLSLVGRSANTTGNVADITAGTDNQVLRRSGTAVGFGAVNLASSDAVTGDLPFANLTQIAGLSVLGVTGNVTADVAGITAGTDNQVLRRSGTSVAFGAVNLASTDAVTGDLPFSNLAQGSALSVLGVTGNSTADNASIAAGTDHQVLRRSGTSVAFGAVNLAQSAAVTGTLAVTNGGTGITSFGSGVATWLGTPSSANLAAAVTDETGSGSLVFATSPTLVTPVLGTPTSGNLSNCTVDGTNSVGFRNIPQNSQSAAYTLVLSDAGKHIFHPSADTTARTFTIPANSSVSFPIGTAITFINQNGAGVVTIAITSDTMRLSPGGTTGSRTLAANGSATCIKVTSTEWLISGSGLT